MKKYIRASGDSVFEQFDRQKYYNLYSDLFHTITDGSNADIPNNIKEAFRLVNGRAFYARAESPTYIKFDGMVGSDYTVGGAITMNYLQGDARRLAEDLTMAYFRSTEGAKVPCNTYSFVNWFKNEEYY
jgi:hypothetical protein